MSIVAFSNNDIVLIAWTYDKFIDGCLGFAVHQINEKTKVERVLPATARFKVQENVKGLTTADAPIQKFWWKDLYAVRGETYTYKVVPMGGTPGKLTPLAGYQPLVTAPVTLTPKRGAFEAYFNRGIVASQMVTHALGDKPAVGLLLKKIVDRNDPLRAQLMGQLFEGVTSLLTRADKGSGYVKAALYELNDKALEDRLHGDGEAAAKKRTVILGNERRAKSKDGTEVEDVDAANRAALKKSGVKVIDRILGKNSIPHNKFMVFYDPKPSAVLTGSTNWTSTGLCTQTNNALIINSPAVAEQYDAYWTALAADETAAKGDQKKLQSSVLRTWTRNSNAGLIKKPIRLEDGSATIEPLFSPNTTHTLNSKNPEVPNDMKNLFDLVEQAKHAVLFLAFDPGNNSILNAAGNALRKNPDLFVRGALTSTVRAGNFVEALHRDNEKPAGNTEGMHVAVIGEPGTPKKKGEKGPKVEPDYRAIPAGHITDKDAFGLFEEEIYKAGFAIIHNKIVVIDPFSDDCVVITGSHNLGYRASSNNDENMMVIRGHRGLAEAYACHVLDIYDHYAWRYWLSKDPNTFGRPLEEDANWQKRYIDGAEAKSPELRFWLNAAQKASSKPTKTANAKASDAQPSAARPASGKPSSGSSKRKPAAKKPAKKKAVGKSKKSAGKAGGKKKGRGRGK
jgi:phosphatidylserine/phosphatidylglycerophosphate/cardiolipin synthase-like enzyme